MANDNKNGGDGCHVPVKRLVSLTMDREALCEPWTVVSEECPLRPHTDALGKKPPRCAAGVMTNVQGAVPIHLCKHYQHDSIVKDGDTLTVLCNRES